MLSKKTNWSLRQRQLGAPGGPLGDEMPSFIFFSGRRDALLLLSKNERAAGSRWCYVGTSFIHHLMSFLRHVDTRFRSQTLNRVAVASTRRIFGLDWKPHYLFGCIDAERGDQTLVAKRLTRFTNSILFFLFFFFSFLFHILLVTSKLKFSWKF